MAEPNNNFHKEELEKHLRKLIGQPVREFQKANGISIDTIIIGLDYASKDVRDVTVMIAVDSQENTTHTCTWRYIGEFYNNSIFYCEECDKTKTEKQIAKEPSILIEEAKKHWKQYQEYLDVVKDCSVIDKPYTFKEMWGYDIIQHENGQIELRK